MTLLLISPLFYPLKRDTEEELRERGRGFKDSRVPRKKQRDLQQVKKNILLQYAIDLSSWLSGRSVKNDTGATLVSRITDTLLKYEMLHIETVKNTIRKSEYLLSEITIWNTRLVAGYAVRQ